MGALADWAGGPGTVGSGAGPAGLWGAHACRTCLVGGPSSRPGLHLHPHRIPRNSITKHRPRSTFHDVATAFAAWETLALVCHGPRLTPPGTGSLSSWTAPPPPRDSHLRARLPLTTLPRSLCFLWFRPAPPSTWGLGSPGPPSSASG